MRENYLSAFDELSIDSLNGDKHETGKLTPEGKPDPSVFSTDFNREGIQVGTAITLLVRKLNHEPAAGVRFREWWGTKKRADLLDSITNTRNNQYALITPPLALGLPFMPMRSTNEYKGWAKLTDLFPVSFPGVKTSRDDLLVDIDHGCLVDRIGKYFDPQTSDVEMQRVSPASMQSGKRFKAEETRTVLRQRGFLPQH